MPDEGRVEKGLFESDLQIVATAVVTHPPGTTYDADGMPIPPPEKKDENK